MEFSQLKYPDNPIPRRELLGEAHIAGYSCLIYKCPDHPIFIAKINGQDFAISVGSLFRTIINTVGIKPLPKGTNEDNVSDGPQE